MTEPVTAKREQVSKKDDKEDNASVQEIMVGSNNMSFPFEHLEIISRRENYLYLMLQADEEEFVRPKEALMRREFYMLWVSRSAQV